MAITAPKTLLINGNHLNYLVQLFQIESNEENIEFSKIVQYKINDFGNGFFISKDGYIASVAHVISDKRKNTYALVNAYLYKIEIIEREFNETNLDHNDCIVGKIDINHNVDFIETSKFEDVSIRDKISFKGYSRVINNNTFDLEFKEEAKPKLIELHSFCSDIIYYYSEKGTRIPMHNFFTFPSEVHNLNGLSGCPIFNNTNKVVGILKGGIRIGKHTMCQALHIKVLNKMLQSLE